MFELRFLAFSAESAVKKITAKNRNSFKNSTLISQNYFFAKNIVKKM